MAHIYRMRRVLLTHPLAIKNSSARKTTVAVHEHRIVLWEKIGPGQHPCHWCGKSLRWAPGEHAGGDVLSVDHLNGITLDNRPANLVPACHSCNVHRNRRVPDDVVFVTTANGKRARAAERTCLTCGETFLTALAAMRSKSKNAGRYCSMACVYARNR